MYTFYYTMVKYVLLKGMEGFGDRLQCLLQGIEYAKRTGRVICVDWRDHMWCHNTKYDFNYYFDIIGIDSITPHKLFNHWHDDKHTVYPKQWQHELDRIPDLYMRDDKYGTDRIRYVVEGKKPDINEDIIVGNCARDRTYDGTNIMHIKIKDNIMKKIISNMKTYGLSKNKYITVHLRGTDRHIDTVNGRTKYINEMLIKLKNVKKTDDEKTDVIILTDSPKLFMVWKYKNGKGRFLMKKKMWNNSNYKNGIHKLKEEDLPKNLSKQKLNIIMIRDFIIMLNSKHIVNDDKSVFSGMALFIKDNASTNTTSWKI